MTLQRSDGEEPSVTVPRLECWVWTCAALVIVSYLAIASRCTKTSGWKPTYDDRPRLVAPERRLMAPGWFWAGCTHALGDERARERCVRENPPRRLWLGRFEIDATHVMQYQYRSCVEAGRCRPLTHDLPNDPELPAVVSWDDARRYCEDWQSPAHPYAGFHVRLPTEVEWERAARDRTDHVFPWGTLPPDCAWSPHRADGTPCRDRLDRAKQYPHTASPGEVHDLYSTVGEWVYDRYGPIAESVRPVWQSDPELGRRGHPHALDLERTRVHWNHELRSRVAPYRHPGSGGVGDPLRAIHVVKSGLGHAFIAARSAGDDLARQAFRCVAIPSGHPGHDPDPYPEHSAPDLEASARAGLKKVGNRTQAPRYAPTERTHR
jgi:hypothetical protein